MPGRCQKKKLFNKTNCKRTNFCLFIKGTEAVMLEHVLFKKKCYLPIKSVTRKLPHSCERSLPPATKSLMLEFVKVTRAAPGCCCRENPAGGAVEIRMDFFFG